MNITKFIIPFVLGIIVTRITVWQIMPDMMLTERRSPYSVNETISKIITNAKAEDWNIAVIEPLNQSIHKPGDDLPVILINLSHAYNAHNFLKEDAKKIISVMMPSTISVYQKADGDVYVATMNADLLGTMFGGGSVAKIMGSAFANQQHKLIAFLNDKGM